jgi:hypothetical protein
MCVCARARERVCVCTHPLTRKKSEKKKELLFARMRTRMRLRKCAPRAEKNNNTFKARISKEYTPSNRNPRPALLLYSVLLYYCTSLLLYFFTTVLLYYCASVLLEYTLLGRKSPPQATEAYKKKNSIPRIVQY